MEEWLEQISADLRRIAEAMEKANELKKEELRKMNIKIV
jgi:hypothetical protein